MHVTPALNSYRSYGRQPAISVAIDEIYALRALCALVLDGFTDDMALASLPASTKKRMENLLPLLSRGTSGESLYKAAEEFHMKDALRSAGVSDTLTESEWARNQGIEVAEL